MPRPAYPNIKTTVKIAKSKADIIKVLESVPDSEVRCPRLVSRPWTCRFSTYHEALDVKELVLIVHFLSVCVVSAVASCECIGLSRGFQPTAHGPPAALRRVLFGPGRVFHKVQCVMNIEA